MIGALISPIASLLGTVVETQMVKQKSKQKILEDAATHEDTKYSTSCSLRTKVPDNVDTLD